MSFQNLNLDQRILDAITKSGYNEPTPIQAQAIPRALAGKDLIATAQTGTGKTAAFVLPSLQCLLNTAPVGKPRVLILTPTRELATQVNDAITKYGTFVRKNVVSILGGMPYGAQMRQLSRPNDIIVATPGRLIDYLERGKIDLSEIKILVLDEADRMLDMGFIDAVKHIASLTPKTRQTLLFTATMDTRLAKLAGSILNDPERIEIAGKTVTLDAIEQRLYLADDEKHKHQLLQHLLDNEEIEKAIIFSATKRNADHLAKRLYDQGFPAGALHGDMNQFKRNATIKRLRQGDIRVLIATDVAARGIDINDVTHVINYDLPRFAEDYVHRIGRTGRAGRSGIAVSLIQVEDAIHLKRIERYTGHTINQATIEGLEPTKQLMVHKPSRRPGNKEGFKKRFSRNSGNSAGGGFTHQKRNAAGNSKNNNGGRWFGNK